MHEAGRENLSGFFVVCGVVKYPMERRDRLDTRGVGRTKKETLNRVTC